MNSTSEVWGAVLALLEKDLTVTAMNTWFSDCEFVELKESMLVLHCPSEFRRNVILNVYLDRIKEALKEIFGSGDFEIMVLTDDEYSDYAGEVKTSVDPFDDSRFTFDRFVVGPSNQLAHAAAKAVSGKTSGTYNPLFIYGGPGLGKTHLLYAIGHELKRSRQDYRIVYIKGDEFTNELVNAIQSGKNTEFRNKYRYADLLMVDDIQFIAGKIQTQEEFFHTFNTLYEAGKQIVLTSDRPPKEMLRLEERLRSRFEWGVLVDIQPPDYETRLAIVRNKAHSMGVPLEDNIAAYIAENVTENIRQLEGTVKKILAYRELIVDADINIDLVERITKEIIRGDREYTPEMIIEKVAAYYSISMDDIKGSSRQKNTALARQIAMYLIRKLINMPLADIGEVMGGKDHSTVMHSIKKIESAMATPDFADIIRDITANITNK
ncbi:MAG: chromosomal replication initiator protein DnaA [Oscillospiraceae bacterium]|nr:chromosomal replication initiator protein DnaA [Oscillospiraceae bacterium]